MIEQRSPAPSSLARYVPRVAVEWDLDAPGAAWRRLDGSLCFVDISGFTNLSERLSRRGRIGAEELTEVLNRVFGGMLEVAYGRGGSLLKFGGDALLLLFEGSEHAVQAACAAVEMRAELRRAAEVPTSVGRVPLRMSTGIHSGTIDFFRAGGSHEELIVAGPAASWTTRMEGAADPGEIVVSSTTRAILGEDAAPSAKGDGWTLKWRSPRAAPSGAVSVRCDPTDETLAAWVPGALREHLRDAGDTEHRIATVAFVEFIGTDDSMREIGAEAVAGQLEALIAAVQASVDREGVTFLASDVDANGGKIILAAGVPLTRRDDEGRVLRAVREILDADAGIPVRVGVNRGHVFAGEIGTPFRATYTIIGDTVNLAARLMSAAPPGSAYVAPSVLDRARTLFATEPLPPFSVKGKADPVTAFVLGEEVGDRPHHESELLPFVGRAEELEALVARIDTARAGSGFAVSVVGDSGIGKTRLVHEAMNRLTGFEVVEVRAEPYGTATPYRAFRDPVRALIEIERSDQTSMATALSAATAAIGPELARVAPLLGDVAHIELEDNDVTSAIEPRFRADRTAAGLLALLAHKIQGPLLVIAEDCHWMDAASTHLLEQLASAASTRPWVIVATRRPGDDGFAPAGAAQTIELGPLSGEESSELVIRATEAAPLLPHDVEALARRSGGIPLFLEELLNVVRETGSIAALPDTIDEVVGAEIDGLAPLPRRLLRYASVLGRSFRISVLRRVIGDEDLALDSATRQELAGLLLPDGRDRLRFRHSLARDVAYEGLPYRARRHLHLRAGAVVEQLAGEDAASVADNLAFHFAAGGDFEKAWRYSRIAGDRAFAVFANVEAAEQYERAVAAARRLGSVAAEDRVAVLTAIGDARERAGRFDEATEAYQRAYRLERSDAGRATLLRKRARVFERTGSYSAALSCLTRAQKLLGGGTTPEVARARADLASFAAVVRQAQERPRMALRSAEAARSLADAVGAAEAAARARSVLGSAHLMLGRPDRARAVLLESLALYEDIGDQSGQAAVTANLGAAAYYDGDWESAVDAYERGRAAALQTGNIVDAAMMSSNIGEVRVNQGRNDEAEPLLRDAARVMRTTGYTDGALFAELQLARILLAERHLDEADALLDGICLDAAHLGLAGTAHWAAIMQSESLLLRGDSRGALGSLAASEAAAPPDYRAILAPAATLVRSRALWRDGDTDAALAAVEEGRDSAAEQGLPYEQALFDVLGAEIAGVAPPPDAIETLRRLNVRRVSVTTGPVDLTGAE